MEGTGKSAHCIDAGSHARGEAEHNSVEVLASDSNVRDTCLSGDLSVLVCSLLYLQNPSFLIEWFEEKIKKQSENVPGLDTCRGYFQNRVTMSALHPSLHLQISLATILSAASPAAVSYFTVSSAYRRLGRNVYWSSLFCNMQPYPLCFYRVVHNSIY